MNTECKPPSDLFPFPNDIGGLGERVLSSPRRLVQTCSLAISEAGENTAVPFEDSYLEEIIQRLNPEETPGQESS